MSTVRSIVFPALRLLVWAVIAAALVVLAFRGSDLGSEPAGGAGPSFVDVQSPPIPVALGTVSNTVSVSGTVVADASVPVKATAAGEVSKLLARPGPVTAGQPLVEIRWEEEREPVTQTDAEGNQTVTQPSPRVRTATVGAPIAGTLTSLDVLKDQLVAVGDRIGTISPGTLSVTASLSQAEQFRLLSPPASAEVEVQGGPAPFTCGGLVLGAPHAGSAEEPDPNMPPGPVDAERRRDDGSLLGASGDGGLRRHGRHHGDPGRPRRERAGRPGDRRPGLGADRQRLGGR
jgi:multidrug efflux pump subunit AcrA (membrane-fusion protein)